jgi:PhnB protein
VTRVSAHIVVPDAAEACAWYARAFGAQEISRVPLPGDRVMSVEAQIGESAIHIGSEFPEAGILSPRSIGGTATVLQITTEDATALWRQALDAGADEGHPLAEQFWGELHGQLTDPFGHRWNIAQKIRDVSPEEIAAAAAEMFGQPSSGSGADG